MEGDGISPLGFQIVNFLNNGKVKISIKERCTGDDLPLPSGIGDCRSKQYSSRVCLIQFDLSSRVCSTCHHWLASYKIARSRSGNDWLTQHVKIDGIRPFGFHTVNLLNNGQIEITKKERLVGNDFPVPNRVDSSRTKKHGTRVGLIQLDDCVWNTSTCNNRVAGHNSTRCGHAYCRFRHDNESYRCRPIIDSSIKCLVSCQAEVSGKKSYRRSGNPMAVRIRYSGSKNPVTNVCLIQIYCRPRISSSRHRGIFCHDRTSSRIHNYWPFINNYFIARPCPFAPYPQHPVINLKIKHCSRRNQRLRKPITERIPRRPLK